MKTEGKQKKWRHREVQELAHEEELLVKRLRELHLWWRQHWVHVVIGVGVVCVIVAVWRIVESQRLAREAQASELLNSARAEFENNNLDAVTTSCEDIIANFAGTDAAPQALVLLGNAYFKGEQYDKALEIYQRYLQAHPKGGLAAHVRRNIALLQARQDPAKAIAELESMLAGHEAYQELLRKHLDSGLKESDAQTRAVKEFNRLHPAGIPLIASDEVRFRLALLHERQGRTAEAVALLKQIGKGSAWNQEAKAKLDWIQALPAGALSAASGAS